MNTSDLTKLTKDMILTIPADECWIDLNNVIEIEEDFNGFPEGVKEIYLNELKYLPKSVKFPVSTNYLSLHSIEKIEEGTVLPENLSRLDLGWHDEKEIKAFNVIAPPTLNQINIQTESVNIFIHPPKE